jgi:hypothetical protein
MHPYCIAYLTKYIRPVSHPINNGRGLRKRGVSPIVIYFPRIQQQQQKKWPTFGQNKKEREKPPEFLCDVTVASRAASADVIIGIFSTEKFFIKVKSYCSYRHTVGWPKVSLACG